jgi:hypothetical protein
MGILPLTCGNQIKTQSDGKAISQPRLGYDPDACPCCKKGRMIRLFAFGANAPPSTQQTIKQLTNKS